MLLRKEIAVNIKVLSNQKKEVEEDGWKYIENKESKKITNERSHQNVFPHSCSIKVERIQNSFQEQVYAKGLN